MSPRFSEIDYLRPGAREEDTIRVIQGAFRQIERMATGLENSINTVNSSLGITPVASSGASGNGTGEGQGVTFIKKGITGPGLAAGHVCYRQGSQWLPAVNTTVGAFASGVCTKVVGGECWIQVAALPVKVKIKESGDADGPKTVWVSDVPGVVTRVRPTASTVAFYQEVGFMNEPAVNGETEILFIPRLEPEQ